ncbi:MAG: DUF2142 domain-containing protein, partial [Atopobiaceae bacterium]|nr:DUF2142 domain-containing protein [Atopobiaceae bacterium]
MGWPKQASDRLCLLGALIVALGTILLAGTLWAGSFPLRLAVLPLVLLLPCGLLVRGCLQADREGAADAQAGSNLAAVAMIACVASAYALTFTPGSVPDETSHYRVSYVYANLITPGFGPCTMRAQDCEFLKNMRSTVKWERFEQMDQASLLCENSQPIEHDLLLYQPLWGNDPEERGLAYMVSTCPAYLKVGSTLGLLVGRACGLGPLPCFMLGRLGNMAFCCLLIGAALNIAPMGREAMVAVCLLPMSVHEIGSLSYDGPILAIALISLALLLRAITRKDLLGRGELAQMCASLLLLGPCKMVYAPLSCLALFIPSSRFERRGHEALLKVLLVAMPFVGIALFRWDKLSALLLGTPAEEAGALDRRMNDYGHFYTLRGLLEDVPHMLRMFAATIRARGLFWVRTMVGGRLAHLQRNLSHFQLVPYLYLLLLLVALPSTSRPRPPAPGLFDVSCTILFAATVFCVLLGEALIWTFDTETLVQGVQGRYFIPALPLLLLPLTCMRPIKPQVHDLLALVFAGADVAYLIHVFVCLAG